MTKRGDGIDKITLNDATALLPEKGDLRKGVKHKVLN
jgi:hypothetical protein